MSIDNLAACLIEALTRRHWKLTCVESCTAGLIMAEATSVPGASAVVEKGYITYSNAAKTQMVGVTQDTLATYGAVSAETAFEMVTGAIKGLDDTAAISVTGIAGPTGATPGKPVGTVWIGTAIPGAEPLIKHYVFDGDRQEVRSQAVQAALAQLLSLLDA